MADAVFACYRCARPGRVKLRGDWAGMRVRAVFCHCDDCGVGWLARETRTLSDDTKEDHG